MVKRLLKKYHYPPEGQEQALRTVMAQCNKWADEDDNFLERKIMSVVADRDISNLINNRLQINPETSDASIQKEVLEVYGERYPDMSLNDWRHIIEDYTPMVRENIKDVDLEEDAKEIPFYYSKAAEDLEKPKDN
jgi:type I restriction enzyme R subunit